MQLTVRAILNESLEEEARGSHGAVVASSQFICHVIDMACDACSCMQWHLVLHHLGMHALPKSKCPHEMQHISRSQPISLEQNHLQLPQQ